MQEVAQWLEQLGMAEYVERFAAHRIDVSVLADLTDQDLKDLGVVLGDRRKLLRAIGELDTAPGRSTAPVPAGAAERRQLTVMFCDLVGSTALSARLDPEDLRAVVGAYHRCCATLVDRHRGFVAQYMGDGVLAYFGYPQADEHDAERAVQAGLAVVEAVPQLVTVAGAPLHARVGIATGLVVVGELIGSGDARMRGVIGETPNLAARLQSVAEPGMVVVAEGTRRLLGNLFELRDLGAKDLKGLAGPVRVWAALRSSAMANRFEALRATELTALVGRDAESELLLERWSRAKSGQGQVVLLGGEAGIGKSRLTAALMDRLAAEPHARLRYFCSPHHTGSALYPVISQMARAAGLVRDDSPHAKLDKVDTMLAQTATSAEDAALLTEMLSLPNDGRHPALALTPPQRRQRTLDALIAQVEALSRSGPVLMIFDDAHWTDPTSLELLGRAVDRLATLRVLLIVTFRPEFDPPWSGRPHVSAVTIHRLAAPDVDAMIDRVAGSTRLSASIRQDILERADGIPLFVEEMTKAVLEAHDARRPAAAGASPLQAVPASLQASLMARLDRLGPARELAQMAAAIGREFSHALIASVACKPATELDSALDRLMTTGLLFRHGAPPHATYLFNHALVQDAAYGTLLREPRRALHARIAGTLEHQFADIAGSQPELVAHHYTEAGLPEHAAGSWAKAGRQSLARSALVEAAAQLARALSQMAALPATAALRREQIKLHVELANALIHTRGHAAPETRASFDQARALIERAEALGESLDDPLVLFSVLYGFWVASRMAFKGDLAGELAAQFHALAQSQRTPAPRLIGHLLMGISLVLVGRLAEGRAHLDQAIALYDPGEHRPLATRFGHDVRVSALSWRALALWMLGHPGAALADTARALDDAGDIGHAATSMFALSHTSLALIHCGHQAAAGALIDKLVALADAKASLYWTSYGVLLQAWQLTLTGHASEAAARITLGTAAMRSTGATAYAPWYLGFSARAHAELGEHDDAWRCIAEALAAVDTTQERWCEAEIHRVAGDIALMSPAPDAARAEACFERALSIAREQNAKSFELRAAMRLARLWRDRGRPRQARDLLAPIYGWFTDGSDTADVAEAQALLDTLAS